MRLRAASKKEHLLEIPRLHFEGIDMQIAHVYVPDLHHGLVTVVTASWRSMSELVSPAGRNLHLEIAICQRGKISGEIV